MTCLEALKTPLQKGRLEGVKSRRDLLIREAIGWGGTTDEPQTHVVDVLPNGLKACFDKPGKEVERTSRANPHDMTPYVGSSDVPLTFDQIWLSLSRVGLESGFDDLKSVLVLVYRNAYLLDHAEIDGHLRYRPVRSVEDCIEHLETRVGRALKPLGLRGMLHFLNLLGWNEDVKYHTVDSNPVFDRTHKFKTGRVNTLLTCVRVPFQVSSLVKHILEKRDSPNEIDLSKVYGAMQSFSNMRGVCVPTNKQLLEWFPEYIHKAPRMGTL